jgi:hypothetical protein
MSMYALYCLRDMLPWHHQWHYKTAEDRWAMTADLLQVWGGQASWVLGGRNGCLHEAGAEPCIAARNPIGLLCLQVVRLAIEAGACVEQEAAGSPVTAPSPPDTRLSSVRITPLAAVTLTHLLFHGGPLLYHCLPPTLDAMEELRQADALSGELSACEGALAALLRLLPCVVSATEAYSHELPVEEFLFLVGERMAWLATLHPQVPA